VACNIITVDSVLAWQVWVPVTHCNRNVADYVLVHLWMIKVFPIDILFGRHKLICNRLYGGQTGITLTKQSYVSFHERSCTFANHLSENEHGVLHILWEYCLYMYLFIQVAGMLPASYTHMTSCLPVPVAFRCWR